MTAAKSREIVEGLRKQADRVRKAIDSWRSATDRWVNATLNLATELYKARQCHPSNEAFGEWLTDNHIDDLSHQDRAALIAMGEFADDAREVLRDTNRRSPRLIWETELRPRLTSAGKIKPPPAPTPAPGSTTRVQIAPQSIPSKTITVAASPTVARTISKITIAADPPDAVKRPLLTTAEIIRALIEIVDLLGDLPANDKVMDDLHGVEPADIDKATLKLADFAKAYHQNWQKRQGGNGKKALPVS